MPLLKYPQNPQAPEKPIDADQNTLRITIGLLGYFLPLILWSVLSLYSDRTTPLSSISHYYYSRVNSFFIVTLGVLAIVLFIYRGRRPVDFWLSAVASIAAICVILLPTNIGYESHSQLPNHFITFIKDNKLRGTVHFTAAGIFLFSLAVISFFRFPRDDSSNEQPNQLDKFMYRLCGIVMVSAMIGIALGMKGYIVTEKWFSTRHGVFWGETVAVCAFGYSWLLKAGFFSQLANYLMPFVRKGSSDE